jgi:hypothetical protein
MLRFCQAKEFAHIARMHRQSHAVGANYITEQQMKLGIYKSATVTNTATSGCGRAFDTDCGRNARGG